MQVSPCEEGLTKVVQPHCINEIMQENKESVEREMSRRTNTGTRSSLLTVEVICIMFSL